MLYEIAYDFAYLCENDFGPMEEISKFAKKGHKWKKMPKGWDKKSRKSYYKSMGKSVTSCMKKMKNKMKDPGAFCASLEDRIIGTHWRNK